VHSTTQGLTEFMDSWQQNMRTFIQKHSLQ